MSRRITPYDTGVVLQPQLWPNAGRDPRPEVDHDWGKVDFESEEGSTPMTIRVVASPRADGSYVIEIDNHFEVDFQVLCDGVIIHEHDEHAVRTDAERT